MAQIDIPKKIEVNPLWDINCQATVDDEVATVTWDLTVPIDMEKYLAGASIIECIPDFPDLNSTNVLDRIDTVEQRSIS